ncbi:hypothetical protein [Alteribacter keqinensis]|uniref:Uncharacterized protein n=1 Tax=Alteribacter keqinensis TaxID=2483800 RepID=A0A3M7TPK5_9BACI|nr:hypothetical protein [Alteribacter keqinensis]RNA67385.1 hypothetical protein EBO34_11630 [Alteribacter keqinensis]
MREETRNRIAAAVILIVIACLPFVTELPKSEGIDEDEVHYHYVKTVTEAQSLFEAHERMDGKYYNERFPQKDAVFTYMEDTFTSAGIELALSTIFTEADNGLVYKEPFQHYLREGYYRTSESSDQNYYDAVKNTILNPGLSVISLDDFEFRRDGGNVILETKHASVLYYNSEKDSGGHFERYGYPPEDKLTVRFTFKEGEDGNLKVQDYSVKSGRS